MIVKKLKEALENIDYLFSQIHLLQLVRELEKRRDALFKERLDFIKCDGRSKKNWKLK